MTGPDAGSILHGVLALVADSGGQLEGRIRLQKSAYLLKMAGDPDFARAHFAYHHYGPSSRELSWALQEAVAAGMLKEVEEEGGEEQDRYCYVLTDFGRQWLGEYAGLQNGAGTIAAALQDAHWRALEFAATVLYLERKEELPDRRAAVGRALQLRPGCSPWQREASELLQRLHL